MSGLSKDSKALLKAAFGEHYLDAWVAWKGNWSGKRVRDLTMEDLPGDTDCYFCAALLKPEAKRRLNENTDRVFVLVIDDVGTKIDRATMDVWFPLEPSYRAETSKGNFQYGYFLDGGMERLQYEALRRQMKSNPDWGHADGIDPVHLFRLPQGTNTKAGNEGWEVRLCS